MKFMNPNFWKKRNIPKYLKNIQKKLSKAVRFLRLTPVPSQEVFEPPLILMKIYFTSYKNTMPQSSFLPIATKLTPLILLLRKQRNISRVSVLEKQKCYTTINLLTVIYKSSLAPGSCFQTALWYIKKRCRCNEDIIYRKQLYLL